MIKKLIINNKKKKRNCILKQELYLYNKQLQNLILKELKILFLFLLQR